jgi:hypothetical protein
MNPDPGGLTIDIDDRELTVTMTGGAQWTLPIGPATLVDGELERADTPHPAQLTNALGVVHDHFDDILVVAPIVAAAPSIEFRGRHAVGLAQVEIGSDAVSGRAVVQRADVDEVFRTLVSESVADRTHNPGLPADQVETIIATCCVVLAIVRRLDLTSLTISGAGD